MEVSEEFIPVIWKALMGMCTTKEHVTIDSLFNKLKERVNTRQTDWHWSRATLHRFITSKTDFCYGLQTSYYKQIKEDVEIAHQRLKYINQIQLYRNEGRQIFYQDETWVNKNMKPLKIWLDENREGGQKVPPGKGERSIICHVGSEMGFVEPACLIFHGKKALKTSDYRTEMNSEVFLDWMGKKFLVTFLLSLWL